MQPAAWHPRGAGPAPGTAPGAPWALQGSSAPRVSISAVTEPRQVTALRLRLPPGPTSPGLDAPGGTDEGC